MHGKKYLLGMGIDLTGRKKTEEALRQSEEKYRAIFENAVEGIFQTTPKGRFVSANPAMAVMLGYDSVAEMIAQVQDVGTEVYTMNEIRQTFINLLKKNQIVSNFEIQFRRKDGRRIWVSLHARPVCDKKGQLHLIEGIVTDITERKHQTEALEAREAYLREENIRLRSHIKDRYRFGDIIGKSHAMQNVYELILKASASDANVIIYGETGTGKELIARAIHKMSDRKSGRFVPVNCGAIPENLLESEFFGYRKGAFTGAYTDKKGFLDLADGGTLFLDELGEIDLNIQVKLLRAIEGGGFTPIGSQQNKRLNFRIIAATNRNLKEFVTKGLMREDFYYRIHIIPIDLPPLRKRKEDIPLLIEHFFKIHQAKIRKNPPLTGAMLEAMLKHDWPGNVRELQNVIHRYFTLNQLDLMNPDDLETSSPKSLPRTVSESGSTDYQTVMDDFEKKIFISILEQHRWNRKKAASLMGLPLRTFYRKMKKHDLVRHK
ncbi:MAG: sigma 54-interacting transcriptional regulator [Proteobacteria bacterium]|nr:sigma 54-interacting transcriptional regulator [Pseudomonadota bacterium]